MLAGIPDDLAGGSNGHILQFICRFQIAKQLFPAVVYVPVDIRLDKGAHITDISETCHGIFKMYVIFYKILLHYPVDIVLRTGNMKQFHFFNHAASSVLSSQ